MSYEGCRALLATMAVALIGGGATWASEGWTPVPTGPGSAGVSGWMSPVEFGGHFYAAAAFGPPLAAQMHRTSDGINWSPVGAPRLGDPDNWSLTTATVHGGELYVGTSNVVTGGELWRTADGVSFQKVVTDGLGTPFNEAIAVLGTFQGYLYLGTNTLPGGAQIWRSQDGVSWTMLLTMGPGTSGVISGREFDGAFYVGTVDTGLGARILRTVDGTTFTPVSRPGFGTASIAVFLGPVFQGALFAGTFGSPFGGDLWRSADGTTWERVFASGDAATGGIEPVLAFGGQLWAGTFNFATGGGILRSSDGVSWTVDGAPGLGSVANFQVSPSAVIQGELFAFAIDFMNPGIGHFVRRPPAVGTTTCTGATNSTGVGATLRAGGTVDVTADCMALTATGCPPHRVGLFFVGPATADVPFGDGRLCVGGGLHRIRPPVVTDAYGTATILLDFSRPFALGFGPGTTASYQLWYSDPAGGPAGFNLSDAVTVVH